MTQKRQRQQKRDQARVAAMQAKRRKAQRQRLGIVILTAVLLVLGVSVFVGTNNGGTPVETAASTSVPAARTPAVLTPVPAGATITGDTPCPKPDGTSARTTQFAKPPPDCLSPARTYTAELTTTKGRFTIALDAKAAPKTVNNFVVLSRYHYYDGIAFHRVVPGFVIQGGDPLASGLGGPGYKFDDELPKAGSYKIGSVAMANTGAANTNGSQFFIIVGDAGTSLPPQYTLFGTVTEGMDIVKSIEAVGTAETGVDPNGGKPTQAITISSITIKET